MWGSSGVSWRPEWGVRTHSAHLFQNMDALSKPTCEPSLLWVNLFSIKLRDEVPNALVPSCPQCHPPSCILPQVSLWGSYQHDHRATKTLSWTTLNTSDQVPGHITPRRSLWGPDPLPRRRVPGKQSADTATPAPAVTLMPSDDPCASTITPALPISPASKTIQVVSVSPVHQPKTSLQPKPAELWEELLQLQEKLTVALEWLLTMRPALNLLMGIGLAGGTLKASEWFPFWWGHKRSHSPPLNCSCSPQGSLQEQHLWARVGGKGGGGKRVPGFCRSFLGSCIGVTTRGPGDLHVSPPATHWWCAAGCP